MILGLFFHANSKIAFMCTANVRKYIDVGIGPIMQVPYYKQNIFNNFF